MREISELVRVGCGKHQRQKAGETGMLLEWCLRGSQWGTGKRVRHSQSSRPKDQPRDQQQGRKQRRRQESTVVCHAVDSQTGRDVVSENAAPWQCYVPYVHDGRPSYQASAKVTVPRAARGAVAGP